MAGIYVYPITQTANNLVSSTALYIECSATGFSQALLGVNDDGTDITISFVDDLTPSEESALSALVSAHDGQANLEARLIVSVPRGSAYTGTVLYVAIVEVSAKIDSLTQLNRALGHVSCHYSTPVGFLETASLEILESDDGVTGTVLGSKILSNTEGVLAETKFYTTVPPSAGQHLYLLRAKGAGCVFRGAVLSLYEIQ